MAEKGKRSFQSYLDAIHAKTGKTAHELRDMAVKKGITKSSDLLDWLKQDYGLGYGHSGAVWSLLAHSDHIKATTDERAGKLFSGNKSKWRKPYDALAAKIAKFGSDVKLSPNMTYVNLLRGNKKFGIVQPSAVERLDIGIKLKGVPPAGRLEASGSWNAMVTHRVRVSDPKEINKELLTWLKQAYDAQAPAEKSR